MPAPSSSPPMAHFQVRLDHLFQTFRAADGGEYTYRQVADAIEQLVGYKTSPSYLQVLRTGVRINPSIKHLHGLCAFFGVPIEYFFDQDVARQFDVQLEMAASLRDPAVRELAHRAVGLSADALETLTRMVEHARHLEGLDARPSGSDAPNGARPAAYPPRRGRRPRARGAGTPSSVPPGAGSF
ncbi:MAG: helix-turn-helix domain-containing protein [Chloroflexota bacterium]|nr:helix-turn-helix domain-containing protein [Chloroflexota bacterium]